MKYNIAVLPGDGIGPEIIKEAVKILERTGEISGNTFDFRYGQVGASAIESHNDPYPEETHRICLESDSVLFGAIGDPRYDNDPGAKVRPEQGLLAMRKKLGLYANIRPVKVFDSLIERSPLKKEIIEGVDFVVIRELTGGIYFGEPRGRTEDGEKAFDTCMYSREEIKRMLDLAYKTAAQRRKKLTVVDKANVLSSSRLWREIAREEAKKHPEIETDYMFVDNAAMQIILAPGNFDVVVTENMFGDILTDEASVITGSLGLMPSASVGDTTSLFEPIHGSYPQAAGKNIANPLGTILSASLMLDYLGLKAEAERIEAAVRKSLEAGVVTRDLDNKSGYGTSDIGDFIKSNL